MLILLRDGWCCVFFTIYVRLVLFVYIKESMIRIGKEHVVQWEKGYFIENKF